MARKHYLAGPYKSWARCGMCKVAVFLWYETTEKPKVILCLRRCAIIYLRTLWAML